jgi:large subunit ribosomal protein L34e
MPRPALRSRSLAKVYKRTPSGKVVIRYRRRKNNSAKCAICKRELNGVKTNNLNKLSKSEKRPERPFGGFLCHKCLESLIKSAIRGI